MKFIANAPMALGASRVGNHVRSSKSVFGALVLVAASLLPQQAVAQEVIPDFYKGPGLDPNRGYVNQSFNEHIDPFNGSLQLHYVDVYIPGNGGFDIKVQRSYNSASVSETAPNGYYGSAGVGWSIHFGRVLFRATVGPCGGAAVSNTLSDPVLELPDGSTQILAASGGSPMYVTTQRWRADCTSNGLTVYAPDGTKYEMRQLVGISTSISAYYTTTITDRNLNVANVTYANASSPQVTSITATESRRIDFAYHSITSNELTPRIRTITAQDSTGDHVFSYDYQAIAGFAGAYNLTKVTRPDGLAWQYGYIGNRNATTPGGFLLSSVTYPEGGSITYGYGSSSSDYVYFDGTGNAASRTTVVKTKSTSDSGSWTFAYSPGSSGNFDTTTVVGPGSTVTYRHAGPNYATSESLWKVGLLMFKQMGSLQTEEYSWAQQTVSSQQFRRPGAWQSTRVDAAVYAPVIAGRVITRDGATYSTTYSNFDTNGNARTVVETGKNGGNRTTTLTYSATNPNILRQVKDESVTGGRQVVRNFDSYGNLLDVTVDGVKTSHLYYSGGDRRQTTFPRSLVHGYSDYWRGVPRTETQPEGVSLSRTVDDAGNMLSFTNGEGFKTTFGFDRLNRLSSITPPIKAATTIGYTATTKTATRSSLSEVTTFDGFGRAVTVTLGGITTYYTRDALGRIRFVSNPGVASVGTTYEYDALDRVWRITNADNSTRTMTYGAASKTVRDERLYSTTYAYRAYGDPDQNWLVSVSNASDSSADVVIGRDTWDQVHTVDQGGFRRTYDYNAKRYLATVENPETGTTIYGRDDAGNLTSRQVGNSIVTVFDYDGQNRLWRTTYPDSTPSVTKTFFKTSKLKSITSSVATRTYGYDANDNLTTESLTVDGVSGTLGYGYNDRDQLSSLTYPYTGRVVAFAPNSLGRPTQASGFVNSVSYWNSGQISQLAYVNGATTTYGQHASRLWPSSFTTATSSQTYLSSSYGYDDAGNLKSISDTVDSSYNRTLDYDPNNRLKTASGPWGSGSITYDGAGNIRTQTFGAYALSYGYDTVNRLSSVSGARAASYGYDSYGNITSTGTATYQYDSAPNMTCAQCSAPTSIVGYRYDGSNRRVAVLKGGLNTYEFYDQAGRLVSELTPGLGNRWVDYIYIGDRRVAQVEPSPTTITSAPYPGWSLTSGRSGTLSVTINGTNPTGTVSFYDGSTLLGTVIVNGGVASLTTTIAQPGLHAITVAYSGDANNSPSTTTVTLEVLIAPEVLMPILNLLLED